MSAYTLYSCALTLIFATFVLLISPLQLGTGVSEKSKTSCYCWRQDSGLVESWFVLVGLFLHASVLMLSVEVY